MEFSLFGYYYIRGVDEYKLISREFVILDATRRLLFNTPPPPWKTVPGVTYVGKFGVGTAIRRFHPADGLLGWRMGRSVSLTFPWAGPGGGVEWYFTNQQGFATSGRESFYYEKQKSKTVFRVIVLGGSTVEGNGAGTPFENLPTKISEEISRHFEGTGYTDKTLELINAGVGGYYSSQEYLYLLTDLVDYEPDLVIVYDGWNDADYLPRNLSLHEAKGTNEMRTPTHQDNGVRIDESYAVGGSFNQFLIALGNGFREVIGEDLPKTLGIPFAVLRLVEKVFGAGALPASELPLESAAEPPSPAAFGKMARLYVETIERILFLAKQRKFRTAVFLQPVIGVDDKAYTPVERKLLTARPDIIRTRRMFYEPARERLSELASRYETLGGVCISDISRTAFAGVKERVYEDAGHLLPAGNELVAKAILAELSRCGLLPG